MHWFRGQDVGELARSARFEQVATLLWKQDGADPFAQPPLEIPLPTGMAPLPRAISLLSIAGEQDLKGLKLTERGVAETGARIIRLLTASFCKMPVTTAPIHERFAEAWGLNEAGADLIRTALILAADHDLNASAFTIRCIASTHATPYGAINPGLCALQGPRHGGQTAQAITHIDDIPVPRHLLRTLSWRVSNAASGYRGSVCRSIRLGPERLLFYPGWRRISAGFPPSISHTISFRRREMPSVSVPISTSPWPQCAARFRYRKRDRSPSSPPAAAPVGSHAQEQYASPELIRPRARYFGDELQSGTPLTAADATSRVGDRAP